MSRESETRKYNYGSAREDAEQRGSGVQPYLKLPKGVSLFEPKKGTMAIDIRPYVVGKGHPKEPEGNIYYTRPFYVHKNVGADNQAHLCLRRVMKEPCPICEFREKLFRDGIEDDDSEDLAKSLAAKERQLFNVINLKDKDNPVQIWDISFHLFGKLLNERILHSDEEDKYDTFFHMENGLTLKVGFNEKSFGGHTFLEATTIDFKPRGYDLDDRDLEESVVLDDILVVTPYDELKKLFHQSISEDGKLKGAKRDNKREDRREVRDSETSSRRERSESEPERERPYNRGPASEEPERASRRDREPAREERSERPSRRDEPEREERRSRRDEPEERPRVHSDEDADTRRGRREPEPERTSRSRREEPKTSDTDKEWDDFAAGAEKSEPEREERSSRRGGSREDERTSRRTDEREEERPRRSRRD